MPQPTLQDCFQAGADAKAKGRPPSDNPHAVGSDERVEWDEGYRASCDLDEEDDPASDRLSDTSD